MIRKAIKWAKNHSSSIIYSRYAWVMDQRDDERERGITIDVGMH